MAIPPGSNTVIIDEFLKGALKEVSKAGEAKGKKMVDQLGGPGAEIALRALQKQVENKIAAAQDQTGQIGRSLAGQPTTEGQIVQTAKRMPRPITVTEEMERAQRQKEALVEPSKKPDVRLSASQRADVAERQKNIGGQSFEFERAQALRRRQELIRASDKKPTKTQKILTQAFDILSEFQGTKGPTERRQEQLKSRAEQLKAQGGLLAEEKTRLQVEGERLAIGFINGTLNQQQKDMFLLMMNEYGVIPFMSGIGGGTKDSEELLRVALMGIAEMMSKSAKE
jgi:hypothetical protein